MKQAELGEYASDNSPAAVAPRGRHPGAFALGHSQGVWRWEGDNRGRGRLSEFTAKERMDEDLQELDPSCRSLAESPDARTINPVWESGHGRDQVACDAALAHQSASVVTLVLRRSNDFVRQFMIFHSESCVSECSADRAAVCGHYLGRGPAVVTLYEHRGWAGPNRAAANVLQKVFGHESFEQHFAGIILGEAHRW